MSPVKRMSDRDAQLVDITMEFAGPDAVLRGTTQAGADWLGAHVGPDYAEPETVGAIAPTWRVVRHVGHSVLARAKAAGLVTDHA